MMTTMSDPRTVNIVVRVSEKDHAAIQRAADRHSMSISEFVRAACLTYMAVDADPHALKLLVTGAAAALGEAVQKVNRLVYVGAGGPPKKSLRQRMVDGD
jgi:hypothetical protein